MTMAEKQAKTKSGKSGRYQVRQGDVLLVPISSIPSAAKNKAKSKLAPVTLALGEVTGHSHRFATGNNVAMLELDEPMDGKTFGLTEPVGRFLQVDKADDLIHEEHDVVPIKEDNLGSFAIVTPREYTPWGERAVLD